MSVGFLRSKPRLNAALRRQCSVRTQRLGNNCRIADHPLNWFAKEIRSEFNKVNRSYRRYQGLVESPRCVTVTRHGIGPVPSLRGASGCYASTAEERSLGSRMPPDSIMSDRTTVPASGIPDSVRFDVG